MDERYRLIFRGEILDGQHRAVVKRRLTELLDLKEQARQASSYHAGEVTGPGTLQCDACGAKQHFHKPRRRSPCPECHATVFHRPGAGNLSEPS